MYKHNNNDNNALELRQEMRQHLIDLVKELQIEGNNEHDAVTLAINRFGDTDTLEKDVDKLFCKKRDKLSLVKILLAITFITCILSMIVFVYRSEKYTLEHAVGVMRREILTPDADIPFDKDDIKKLEAFINNTYPFDIKYFKIYRIEDDKNNGSVSNNTLFNLDNHEVFDDKVLIPAYKFGEHSNPDNQSFAYDPDVLKWYVEYEVDEWKNTNYRNYYYSHAVLFLVFAIAVSVYLNQGINKARLRYNIKKI